MRYFHFCAHEQFPPDDLLRQAVEAEEAGFDGIACSDHFQPWWEPGESGMAWVWLGAVGEATSRVSIGTAVTPALSRYHPALVAQAWATLEVLFPGRTFLGVGSGEALNESPFGADWPPPAAQFSWASDDEAALEGARVWKGAQPEEFYTEDWHDPRAMYEHAAAQVSDDDLEEKLIVSSDPDEHAERIRAVEQLGATAVCLMNV